MSKKLREIRKYKFWECPECTSTYVFYHSKRDVFYCGNCGIFFTADRSIGMEKEFPNENFYERG